MLLWRAFRNLLCQRNFFLGGQQGIFADFFQIQADRVVGTHTVGDGQVNRVKGGVLAGLRGLRVVFIDDGHAERFEILQHLVQLIRLDVEIHQAFHNLLVGQRALLLAVFIEVIKPLLAAIRGLCQAESTPFSPTGNHQSM